MSSEFKRRLKAVAFVSFIIWLWLINIPHTDGEGFQPIAADTHTTIETVDKKDFKAEEPLTPVIAEVKKDPAPAQSEVSNSGSLQQWLHTLRMCESGGNYQINTGNNYYGAYQFLITTWDSVARKVRPDLVGVRPDLASPADQDYMIVQNTKLSTGGLATQNPGCYQKHGLSAFPPS